MEFTFAGRVIEWRGPAPYYYYYYYYYVPVPDEESADIREITVGDEITVEMTVC
jgi:hypothetical protein